jgi:hypothetical protein
LHIARISGIVSNMHSKQIEQYVIAFAFAVALLVTLVKAPATSAKDEKLKPEELIAKHLDSIGPADKRKAVQSRAASGTTQAAFRVGGSGTYNGNGNILSQEKGLRLGFSFNAIDYPGEQIAYDGNKVTVKQSNPGVYPPFSRFIYENDYLIKEGLLFGTLSTQWALLDVPKQAKMEVTGLKKINGKQLYELKYTFRNSKGMQAWFYFDPETFRHVRSEFKLELAPTNVDKITDSAEQVRYHILEQFDEFKPVDGLTLPYSYKLDFTIDAPKGGLFTSWAYAIRAINHNESFEKNLFSVQ